LHDMMSSHNNSTAMVSQMVLDKGVVVSANIPQITIKSVVLLTNSDLAANPSPASTHLVAASHISSLDLDGGPVGADMVTMGEKPTISIDSVADAASPFMIMPTTTTTSLMAISTTTVASPMAIDLVADAALPSVATA